MGLDMYLYNVIKPTMLDERKIYETDEWENLTEKYDIRSRPLKGRTCQTIKNNSVTVMHKERHFIPKMFSAITPYKGITGLCNTGYSQSGGSFVYDFDLYDKGENKLGSVQVTEKNYLLVTKEVIVEERAYILEEVDYQRKGLTDRGWENLPSNCYYSDSLERMKRLCSKNSGLDKEFLNKFKKGHTVFMAWW